MSRLHLALLGAPQVSRGEHTLHFPTRKALALVIYLAVEGGAHTRARLIALLWPASDAAHGRLSLRRTLGQLRDALGERSAPAAHIRSAEDSVEFDSAGATLDLDLLRGPPESAELRVALEAVLAAYRGDFLDGFGLPDAPEFDTWVSVQRERWHRQMALALDRLSALALARGDTALAIGAAQRWIAHDPFDEAAHQRLIETHAAMGSRTLALQAYAALKNLLARELGAAPSPAIGALIARIHDTPQNNGAAWDGVAGAPARAAELPMVGRAAELQRLIGVYHTARAHATQVVAIEGEAGIGKTRLAAEFLNWAAAAGADVLRGRAFEAGGRVPYQPLVDALRPRLDRENAPADLLDDVWLAELARLLPELRERYPDLPAPIADATTVGTRLFESVIALLASLAARAPLVCFVDDIQWADIASLDLIHYAVRRLTERRAPVLILCTIRAEDLIATPSLGSWLASLQRDGALTRLGLATLSASDTELLLAALAAPERAEHAQASPDRFARWLFGETGGQPLYMVETLKVLIERGVLAIERDRAEHAQLRLIGDLPALRELVPPTVRDVIRARLAQLAPEAQALLAAAAVLGRAIMFEHMCGVAGLAEHASLPALDQLLARRLLIEQAAAYADRRLGAGYSFTHDKIRDVVYTEAGDARRRMYHRRAFELLAGAPASERAHHALQGGLIEAAYTYSIAAGDEALRLFAAEDAIGAYEQARSLVAMHAAELGAAVAEGTLGRLYMQLGRAYELLSALDQADAIYRELLAIARLHAWASSECVALNRLATLVAQRSLTLSVAIDYLHEAQAVATRTHSMADLAETEWNLAQLHFYNAQPELAHAHGQAALRLAREHGLPELAARSLNVLALACSAMARCGEAARHGSEASATYAALGNRALQADSLAITGSALINQGQVREGLRLASEGDAINRAIGNVWGRAACAMTRAGGLCDSGSYGAALAAAAEAVQLVRERPVTMLMILTLGVLGATQRAALQLDAARATHLEAWALVTQSDARLMIDMIAAELCADHALAGDMAAAASYARAALDMRDYVFTLYMGRVQWQQTAALIATGAVERARADLERFDQRIGPQLRYQIGSWCAHAALAQAAGDRAQAVAALEHGLSLAAACDLPGEQWPILSCLAAAYQARGDGERARAAEAQATAIVQQLAGSFADAQAGAAFLRSAAAVRSNTTFG